MWARRADAVQSRALLDARRAHMQHELDKQLALRRVAVGESSALESRWIAAWSRCGFAPMAAESMRAWLVDLESCREARARVAALSVQRDALVDELAAFVAEGRRRLALPAPASAELGSAEDLREEAQRRLDALGAHDRQRQVLRAQVERENTTVAVAQERLAALRTEATRWSARWSEVLAALGLVDDDVETLSPAAARRVVQELLGAQELLGTHHEHATRREALHQSVAEFERAAAALGALIALPAGDATSTVTRAHQGLREARDAERASAERRRALATTTLRHDDVRAALAELEAAQAATRAALGVEDEAAHTALLERAERAAAARLTIEQASRALRRGCGEGDLEAHLAALDAAVPEALRLDLAQLDGDAERLESEARALHGEAGELRQRLRAIDGGSAAAELEAEAASVRAALRSDVERWNVLTLAEEILRASIRRFELDHQPELLASASRLIADMTGGRWTRVVRRIGGALLLERAGGEPVGPELLSTGTREQLYLALRLAYVEHYGRRAEPLPLVLDDVLVNFDAARTAATLGALARFAANAQVVLFTCHASLVELARASGIACASVALPTR
ncbi:MAG: hypothetical protein NVSMB47_10820 [Polyangiales bacterium]